MNGSPEDEEAIRRAAESLLGFVGAAPPVPGALQAYMEMMRWAENERRGAVPGISNGVYYAYGYRDALQLVIDKARQMAEWTEKQG